MLTDKELEKIMLYNHNLLVEDKDVKVSEIKHS